MNENIHADKMNPNKIIKNSLLLTSSYIKQKLMDCFRKLHNKIYIFYIKFLNFSHTYNHTINERTNRNETCEICALSVFFVQSFFFFFELNSKIFCSSKIFYNDPHKESWAFFYNKMFKSSGTSFTILDHS